MEHKTRLVLGILLIISSAVIYFGDTQVTPSKAPWIAGLGLILIIVYFNTRNTY